MAATIDLLDHDGTFIKTLSDIQARGIVLQRQGAGAGSIALHNTNSDLPDLVRRRLIRYTLDGTAVGTWMLWRRRTVRRSADPSQHVTVWSGPGALATLGTGRIPGTVVEGDGQTGRKTFGWVSPDFDDSGASEPSDRGFVRDVLPPESDFADRRAQFLGSALGNVTYARRFIDTDARPAKIGWTVRAEVVGTGNMRFWWDGEELASGAPWEVVRVSSSRLGPLAAGGHQIALYSDDGPVGLGLYRVDAETGEDIGVAYRSFTQAVYGTGDPDPWVGWDNGDSPDAVTATIVADRLLTAGQTRGTADGVTETFTDTADTDAQPLSVSLPIVTYRDGEKLGDVLFQCTQQFSVDVRMSPTLELQVYDDLGTDLSGTIILADSSTDGRIGPATLDEEVIGANAIRIGTSGGYGWTPSTSGVPAGDDARYEDAATFGTAETVAEVVNASDEVLDEQRGTRRQTFTTVGPAGYRPTVDYGIGDRIGIQEADGGAVVAARVEEIQIEDNDNRDDQLFTVTVERRL